MYKFEGILCDSACSDRRSSKVRVGGGTIDRRSLSRAKIRTSFSPCLADTKKSAGFVIVLLELPATDGGLAPSKSEVPPKPSSKENDDSAVLPAVVGCA
jgi:hypothetical protein